MRSSRAQFATFLLGVWGVWISLFALSPCAHATDGAFTSETAFLASFPGTPGNVDFEALPPGSPISAPLPVPGASAAIALPAQIPDALGSAGAALDLQVVADTGNNPAGSGAHSLGVVDPGNFDAFAGGSVLDFSFTEPTTPEGSAAP